MRHLVLLELAQSKPSRQAQACIRQAHAALDSTTGLVYPAPERATLNLSFCLLTSLCYCRAPFCPATAQIGACCCCVIFRVRARDRFRRLGEYVKITVWLRMLTANTNYPIVKLCRTNKRSLNWRKKHRTYQTLFEVSSWTFH